MSIQVTLTGTRTDETTALWWESTDPEIATLCQGVKDLATSMNIPHQVAISDDKLTFTSKFECPDIQSWLEFNELMQHQFPDLLTTRLVYFLSAQHTLHILVYDDTAEQTIRDEMLIETYLPG